MEEFEKLGVFYLGGQKQRRLLLYDSKDLVTHAVCVGMTGSGKTGLCITLLEEAAIDGIPAIIIDPKGDLCNLLLTFPNLSPEEFRHGLKKALMRRSRRTCGRKALPSGARTANELSVSVMQPSFVSTRRAATQACPCRSSNRLPRHRKQSGKTAKHSQSESTPLSRACSD